MTQNPNNSRIPHSVDCLNFQIGFKKSPNLSCVCVCVSCFYLTSSNLRQHVWAASKTFVCNLIWQRCDNVIIVTHSELYCNLCHHYHYYSMMRTVTAAAATAYICLACHLTIVSHLYFNLSSIVMKSLNVSSSNIFAGFFHLHCVSI